MHMVVRYYSEIREIRNWVSVVDPVEKLKKNIQFDDETQKLRYHN